MLAYGRDVAGNPKGLPVMVIRPGLPTLSLFPPAPSLEGRGSGFHTGAIAVQVSEMLQHRMRRSHASDQAKRARNSQPRRDVNVAMLKFLIHYEYRNTSARSGRSFGIRARIVIAAESEKHASRILQARGDASCAKNHDTSFSFHIVHVTRAPDHLRAF